MTTNQATAAKVKEAMGDQPIKSTADAAGIPVSTFRRKLAGHTPFTVTELSKVADVLNVAPVSLLPDTFQDAA